MKTLKVNDYNLPYIQNWPFVVLFSAPIVSDNLLNYSWIVSPCLCCVIMAVLVTKCSRGVIVRWRNYSQKYEWAVHVVLQPTFFNHPHVCGKQHSCDGNERQHTAAERPGASPRPARRWVQCQLSTQHYCLPTVVILQRIPTESMFGCDLYYCIRSFTW